MQNALGELKVLVVKLILDLFWGSVSGMASLSLDVTAMKRAMKGMLMKAIRMARGEHLPQGLTLCSPRWYFIFFFPFLFVLHLFSPFAIPLQVQGIIVEMIQFLLNPAITAPTTDWEIVHQWAGWPSLLDVLSSSSRWLTPQEALKMRQMMEIKEDSEAWVIIIFFCGGMWLLLVQ